MSAPRPAPTAPNDGARRPLLARRNLVLLVAALLVLVGGYLTLSAGHPSAAAALLVLGYCVLFPLAIAL